jgi:hypothetical protein
MEYLGNINQTFCPCAALLEPPLSLFSLDYFSYFSAVLASLVDMSLTRASDILPEQEGRR